MMTSADGGLALNSLLTKVAVIEFTCVFGKVGGSSGGKALSCKHEDLDSIPRTLGRVACICKFTARETGAGGFLGLAGSPV